MDWGGNDYDGFTYNCNLSVSVVAFTPPRIHGESSLDYELPMVSVLDSVVLEVPYTSIWKYEFIQSQSIIDLRNYSRSDCRSWILVNYRSLDRGYWKSDSTILVSFLKLQLRNGI